MHFLKWYETKNMSVLHQDIESGTPVRVATPCLRINHDYASRTSDHVDAATLTDPQLDVQPLLVDDSDSRFMCHICLDTVTDPVITQCGHLYCWTCLYRWMDSRRSSSSNRSTTGGNSNSGGSTCPVCKAGISASNVIPVYIRGDNNSNNVVTTNSSNDIASLSGGAPPRPIGHRPAPEPDPSGRLNFGFGTFDPAGTLPIGFTAEGRGGGGGGGRSMTTDTGVTGTQASRQMESQLEYSRGSGYFPSLFSLQFQQFVPPLPAAGIQTQQRQAHMTTEHADEDAQVGSWINRFMRYHFLTNLYSAQLSTDGRAGTAVASNGSGIATDVIVDPVQQQLWDDEQNQQKLSRSLVLLLFVVLICLFVI